jgi:hypothetical protein
MAIAVTKSGPLSKSMVCIKPIMPSCVKAPPLSSFEDCCSGPVEVTKPEALHLLYHDRGKELTCPASVPGLKHLHAFLPSPSWGFIASSYVNLHSSLCGCSLHAVELPACRWFVKRAAAIKSVHVSATLAVDEKGAAARNLLKAHLPLLAGCLSKHVPLLELTFTCKLPCCKVPITLTLGQYLMSLS